MTSSIVPIVEGHAEVESIPILMRRLRDSWHYFNLEISKPIRVNRYQIVKEGELERRIKLAMTRPNCRAIVIVLDADDDCPKNLAPQLLNRAVIAAPQIPISVVLPKSELESWFIGSIESLRGKHGISVSASSPTNPEDMRGAKEFLTNAMERNSHYIETIDQPALAALFDIDLARRNCRSFRKFWKDFNNITSTLFQDNY
jgi:hypothetical protein